MINNLIRLKAQSEDLNVQPKKKDFTLKRFSIQVEKSKKGWRKWLTVCQQEQRWSVTEGREHTGYKHRCNTLGRGKQSQERETREGRTWDSKRKREKWQIKQGILRQRIETENMIWCVGVGITLTLSTRIHTLYSTITTVNVYRTSSVETRTHVPFYAIKTLWSSFGNTVVLAEY